MRLIRWIYSLKSHINIARGEVGWVTGWLPEIFSVVGLLYIIFDYKPTPLQTIIFIPWFILFLASFGYFWKVKGLYKIETTIDASIHPVNNEIYQAACKINKTKVKLSEKVYDEHCQRDFR